MAKSMDGERLEVGMDVGFKADVEEYGTIKSIKGDWVTVNVWDGDEGCDKPHSVHASDIWVE